MRCTPNSVFKLNISVALVEKMEVDALALIVIVISVSLTTFVCSVLGKYCFEKFLVEPVEYRRKRSTRASRYRRSVYHCHHCPPPSQPEIQQPSIKNENRLPGRNSVPDHVAVNIIQGATAASSDSKLYTFAQNAPPINISNPGNPSQTFVRLGMRSSREARSFDYDHQFQTSESSGVADGMNWGKIKRCIHLGNLVQKLSVSSRTHAIGIGSKTSPKTSELRSRWLVFRSL